MIKKSEEEELKETIEYVKMREGINDPSEAEKLLKVINRRLASIEIILVIGFLILILK
jgi:hypothetical protein